MVIDEFFGSTTYSTAVIQNQHSFCRFQKFTEILLEKCSFLFPATVGGGAGFWSKANIFGLLFGFDGKYGWVVGGFVGDGAAPGFSISLRRTLRLSSGRQVVSYKIFDLLSSIPPSSIIGRRPATRL